MQQLKKSINKSELFTISNDKSSKTSVLILHGYAEHIMRYERFMNQLDEQGFRVMGYDHQGHGQSSGTQVMIGSFDEFVEDLHAVANEFFNEGDNNFIFAHSMGGLILSLYLQKYGTGILKGVITSGSAIKMYEKTPIILEKLAGIIAMLFPSLPTLAVDGSTVSKDPNEVKKYNEDPLNFRGKTKAKFGHEFLKAQKLAEKNMDKITTPILIFHGSEDKLIDPASSTFMMEHISSEDKTLKIWEGLFHEILNEPEKDIVASEIIGWIKSKSN